MMTRVVVGICFTVVVFIALPCSLSSVLPMFSIIALIVFITVDVTVIIIILLFVFIVTDIINFPCNRVT